MSAVTLGLTTRPVVSPAGQSEVVIPTCETSEKFHRTVLQGLKPVDSQARIVGAKAPTHKTMFSCGLILMMMWAAVLAPRAASQAVQKPASVTTPAATPIATTNTEIPGNEACAK